MTDETDALREAIHSKDPWTAKGLAKAIGATPQQVGQWLNGNRPIPVSRALVIEEHYDVDAERLNKQVSRIRAKTGEK